MTKKAGSKKRILKTVLPIVLLATVAVALAWAIPRLPQTPQTQNAEGYQGVVELLNVESFEGGVGSRESWLKNRAAKFEKAHQGLFVHVTTLSTEQLAQKLDENAAFDMVCFSRGAGALLQDKLAALDCPVFAKNNFLISGQLNGVQYAMPLYSGVYCLFARAEMLKQDELLARALTQTYTRKVGKNNVTLQPLTCGFTPYNSPLSALAMSGGRGSVNASEDITQYAAYEQFLANRTAVTLLGTQRDMYRLSQREADGRIESLAFVPLTGYTDLVQYVGISGATEKRSACDDFLTFLLNRDSQSTLTSLCLFSVLDEKFYTSERYAAAEEGLFGAYVPNAFGDGESITRQRQMALETLAV